MAGTVYCRSGGGATLGKLIGGVALFAKLSPPKSYRSTYNPAEFYELYACKLMGDLTRKALEDLQKFGCLSTRFPKTNIVVALSILLSSKKILKFAVYLERSMSTTKADRRANGKDAKRAKIATSNISAAGGNSSTMVVTGPM